MDKPVKVIKLKPVKRYFSLEEVKVLCLSSFEAGKHTGWELQDGEIVATIPWAYDDWEKEHLN